MKQIFRWTLAIVILVAALLCSVGLAETGGIDGNITWSVSNDGVLTINGTGPMNSYAEDYSKTPPTTSAPWGGNITGVIIEDGVTSIGDYAFWCCPNLSSVSLPDTILTIGDWSFEGCTSLVDISIPYGVTTIGNNAFAECPIESLSLPNSVTVIRNSAFMYCSHLTDIIIPNSVSSLGASAFSGCSNLAMVALPEGLTELKSSVFKNCESMVSVNIPVSIATIRNDAFLGCNSLMEVIYLGTEEQWNNISIWYGNENLKRIVARTYNYGASEIFANGTCGKNGDNVSWTLTYGGTLTLSGTGETQIQFSTELVGENEITAAPWGTTVTQVIIEEGVTRIGGNAFLGCDSITSVQLPDSLTIIGGWAFMNCTNLQTIMLPPNITTLGSEAFSRCTSLTNVSIPGNVLQVNVGAFAECTGITEVTIEAGVEAISNSAFYGCTSLDTITIPDSVASILDDAFANCSNLSEVRYTGSKESWNNIAVGNNNSFLVGATVTYNYGVIIDWADPVYTWDENNSSVTAIRVNVNDATHMETETVQVTSEVILQPTCEAMGETTYTSEGFQNAAFVVQSKTLTDVPALGHAWSEPAYSWNEKNTEVTATRVCANDAEHVETETVSVTGEVTKQPTCEEMGETTYTSGEFQNTIFAVQSKTLTDVLALGHAWSVPAYTWNEDNTEVTATRICTSDAKHEETETVSATEEVTKLPTCEELGETTYTSRDFQNAAFTVQSKTLTDISALGHTWNEPTYTWNEDNTEVTATRVCAHDANHTEVETAIATRKLIARPTEDTPGAYEFISSAFENDAFVIQHKAGGSIPAIKTLSVLRLPSGLLSIGEEAFAASLCQAVIIPAGCTTIESKAFAGCTQLVYVYIPASVTHIADDAFEECGLVILDRAE